MEIKKGNVPCWYELSWIEKETAILLRVHKDFIKKIKIYISDKPDLPLFWIIGDFKESYFFEKFSLSFDENFGYNDAFLRIGEKEGFVEFLIKIPEIQKYTDEICPHCKGSGKDEYSKRKCSWCLGKGKNLIFQWKTADAISASFAVFFVLSRFPHMEPCSDLPQLFTVGTTIKKEMNGAAMWGTYSSVLCQWLRSMENTDIPESVQAMESASKRLFSIYGYDEDEFRVQNNRGFLIIDCPGDRCGIHPFGDLSAGGYDFGCHNVDNAAQQITILAGLAALHDKARKEISKF